MIRDRHDGVLSSPRSSVDGVLHQPIATLRGIVDLDPLLGGP